MTRVVPDIKPTPEPPRAPRTAPAAAVQTQAAQPAASGTAQKPAEQAVAEQAAAEQSATPATAKDPAAYATPFCAFLTASPTVFHAVHALRTQLTSHGYKPLSSRDAWTLRAGGKYVLTRNGSALIAFAIGARYKPGNGVAMVAGHVDNVSVRVKPVGRVAGSAGYARLGVAPYAGGLGPTWWDRDLGIAGRVVVRDGHGVSERLVELREPIARIPTLAEHFGAPAAGPFNQETQMVPIIGLEGPEDGVEGEGALGSFVARQPKRLVKAVAAKLGLEDYNDILNWELDLYDIQPAVRGGLDKEFIYGGRIDDKLCSWAAVQALLESDDAQAEDSIRLVALFDDEEVGSGLRQGAKGNFLPSTIERIVESFSRGRQPPIGQTYANSFLVSADVIHAVNPNFTNVYLPGHMPSLNVGVTVSADPNGHMTTDAVSMSFLQRVADKSNAKLQVFQIRNDSRSGGTVGPMLSSVMGCRSVDAGCPQLSMHSIRATTGALDPGLGVQLFRGFYNHFEEVDKEFRKD